MGNHTTKILKVLDADSNGDVSPHELREWIAAEKWAGNSYFEVAETNERLQAVLKKLDDAYGGDSAAYKAVSRTELTKFFDSFSEADLDKLCESLLVEESKRKGKLVDQVFKALDREADGKVTLQELADWIKFEGVFQTAHHFDKAKIKEKAEASLKAMDLNKDGVVSRDELDKYFAAWSSHQMRRVTTDLIAHSRKRHTQHQLILDRLDSDKSGYVSPDEIREWARDEKFAGNTRLLRLLDQLKADTKFDETKKLNDETNIITRSQLNWFLNSLSTSDFEYLAKCVLTDEVARVGAIVQEVFEAMDTNNDGSVDAKELTEWITLEALFQITHDFDKKRIALKQKEILAHISKKPSDAKVTLPELRHFFRDWTMREIRSITESLLTRSRKEKADKAAAAGAGGAGAAAAGAGAGAGAAVAGATAGVAGLSLGGEQKDGKVHLEEKKA